jgi:hypothetical protein
MNRRSPLAYLWLPLGLMLASAQTPAAQQPPQPTPAQLEAMLAELRPAAEHKILAGLEGRWAMEITYNMGGPQAKPMTARGTATNRMILGGRFLQSEGVSDNPMPTFGDAKVEMMTIYGFDRRTKEFTTVGLDTMGTYWVTAAGTMRPDRTIVMAGETLDDHAGAPQMRKYDMVLRIVDATSYVSQVIFKFPNQPDLKIVEIVHRRIK